MKFRPIGKRVVVRRTEDKEQTKEGIIIPETAQEISQEGEVVAVGPGVKDDTEFQVEVGDSVLLPKYGGTPLKLEGVEYIIIEEESILGVFGQGL